MIRENALREGAVGGWETEAQAQLHLFPPEALPDKPYPQEENSNSQLLFSPVCLRLSGFVESSQSSRGRIP